MTLIPPWLIALFYGLVHRLVAARKPEPTDAPHGVCAACGGPMRMLWMLSPQAASFDTS